MSDWHPDIERGRAYGWATNAWTHRGTAGLFNVWHTTGIGPIRRHRRNPGRHPTPLDAAEFIYSAGIMRSGPHFLICGETGRIKQLAPLSVAAWHVGSAALWELRQVPKSWLQRWTDLQSPRELAGGHCWTPPQYGRKWSCNARANGIEIVPDQHSPYGPLSDACWRTLAKLTQWLERFHGIPNQEPYQISHWDAAPWDRGGERPWDLRPSRWTPQLHVENAKVRSISAGFPR